MLRQIYNRRFCGDLKFRRRMYGILCSGFFQRYIPRNSVLLEVGAGYCEFINAIKARKKIAVDFNPDTKKFADRDVEVVLCSSVDMRKIKSETVDVVYVSNLFEHLGKNDIVKTVKEVCRVLRKDGRFLILQPNIRYCYKDYWMFFDHITPLDDRSISEVLEINGFKVIECRAKFLPYTTKCKLSTCLFLLRLYLKIPLLQKIFGKQAFILAKKL